MTPKSPCRRARGFTLIEVMVVLVIMGVLAALIVPNVLERADDARVTAARSDINNLMQALKLYKLDNQRYPTGEQGLQALVSKPTSGPIPPNWKPYLDKLPADPWGRPYQYLNPGVKGEIDVFSYRRRRPARRRRQGCRHRLLAVDQASGPARRGTRAAVWLLRTGLRPVRLRRAGASLPASR